MQERLNFIQFARGVFFGAADQELKAGGPSY
jgi:hypothetical protein